MSNDAPVTAVPTAPEAAIVRPRAPIVYDPQNPASLYMDAGAFEQIQRVGKMLASSALVPDHLRSMDVQDKASGKWAWADRSGDCALIFVQALRWGLDPLAVAQATFVVHGKLGYEGKLIAALINMFGDLSPIDGGMGKGRLVHDYSEAGDKRKIVVRGIIRGETKERTVEGTFALWHTKDKSGQRPSDQWTKQPDSMLWYRGAREWARAHMPELLLGLQTPEDAEGREPVELPARRSDGSIVDPLVERLRAQTSSGHVVIESPAPPKEPCSHPLIKPSALAFLPASKSIVCTSCGEDFPGRMPARVPGEDDGEDAPVLTSETAKPAPATKRERTKLEG